MTTNAKVSTNIVWMPSNSLSASSTFKYSAVYRSIARDAMLELCSAPHNVWTRVLASSITIGTLSWTKRRCLTLLPTRQCCRHRNASAGSYPSSLQYRMSAASYSLAIALEAAVQSPNVSGANRPSWTLHDELSEVTGGYTPALDGADNSVCPHSNHVYWIIREHVYTSAISLEDDSHGMSMSVA
ncbi:hypothetical protein PsYK624_008600 [Phanerochaete sordida]|uniref:Uncharacterized protein n=1 Tax=Phanerochaete sordida TaxID=48140 RepID=A0A9P3FZ36_9APHY|nr:hypothetical protein PsYK624_008600 [Phanerochaete sordida]